MQVPAIQTQQSKHKIYQFSIDAKQIFEVATVQLLARGEDGAVQGFQRDEVKKHVGEIRKYVETAEHPMIPNAIVMGTLARPRFTPVEKGSPLGILTLPKEPALIVDGHQRSAALRDAAVEGFQVLVNLFVAETEQELKEHFVRVNSSKPVQKSILYELVPGIDEELSAQIERKRLPVLLLSRLNHDEDSPLQGLVKTPTSPDGLISDSSLLRMLEASLDKGYLFNLRDNQDGTIEPMVDVVKNFYRAVADAFKDAWGLPHAQSRLFHSSGILALGFLMDNMAEVKDPNELSKAFFAKWLKRLRPHVHWVEDSGKWDFGGGEKREWNGVENTVRGAELLGTYLVRKYRTELKKGEEAA